VLSHNLVPNLKTAPQSSSTLLTGKKFGMLTDGRCIFGAAGLVRIPYADKKDINARAEKGIIVGRVRNSKGILLVFVPSRGKVVRRYKYVKKIVTEEFKTYLEERFDNEDDSDSDYEDDNIGVDTTDEYISMTVDEALSFNKEKSEKAILDEVKQMFDMNVFTPRFMHELTEVEKRRIIPSKMVMKMKYTAEGKEDRMKGRFAAGGHRQIQPEGTDNYSPTSDITSFFLLISIASKRKMHMMTTDVKGAYLQTSMPISGPKIHMRISNTIATKMVELDPTYASYRQPNGTVIVELDKALYGIKEAALLWYNNIKEKLTTYGFTTSNKDSCLFYKREANQKLTCLC